jgi:hypothetical protein
MPRGVDVEPLRRAVADKLAAEAVLTAGAAS